MLTSCSKAHSQITNLAAIESIACLIASSTLAPLELGILLDFSIAIMQNWYAILDFQEHMPMHVLNKSALYAFTKLHAPELTLILRLLFIASQVKVPCSSHPAWMLLLELSLRETRLIYDDIVSEN